MTTKAQSKETTARKKPVRKASGKTETRKPAAETSEGNGGAKSKFDETMANVVAGASKGVAKGMEKASEEAPKIAAKTSEIAKEGYGKLKKGLSIAYDRGSKLSREAYREAKEQAERFKHTMEMRKLKSHRRDLCADLGKTAYSEIIVNGMPATDAFSENQFLKLVEEIRRVDEEIVELAKELAED